MSSVWKDILYPGKWHLRDGRTFECSPADLTHYAGRMQEMIDAGLPIPVTWEHQASVKPGASLSTATADERRAERTKLSLGHTSGVRSSAGFLETQLEVPDADDAKKLPAVRFVSPFIEWDFVDGSGKRWDGPSITHIAVTPRPIQHTQKPFAMSLDGAGPCRAIETVNVAGKIYVPGEYIPTADLRKLPVALSLSNFEGPMDDDKTKKPAPGAEKEPAGDDTAEDAGLEAPEDQSARVAQMVEMLIAHKVILGEGVTMDNFFDRLEAALGTKAAHDGTDPGGMNNPDTQAQAQEVSMSAAANGKKTANGKTVALSAEAVGALQSRADRAEAKLLAGEHKALLRRIDSLVSTGRINRPLYERLKREATAVSLSLDSGSGEVIVQPIISKVEAYEALPAGAAGGFTPAQLSAAEEVEPPSSMKGRDNRKAQEEAGDELARLAGAPTESAA